MGISNPETVRSTSHRTVVCSIAKSAVCSVRDATSVMSLVPSTRSTDTSTWRTLQDSESLHKISLMRAKLYPTVTIWTWISRKNWKKSKLNQCFQSSRPLQLSATTKDVLIASLQLPKKTARWHDRLRKLTQQAWTHPWTSKWRQKPLEWILKPFLMARLRNFRIDLSTAVLPKISMFEAIAGCLHPYICV